MNIDFRLLRIQYKWLLTMPECDEREGLLNFIESLCGIDESHKQDNCECGVDESGQWSEKVFDRFGCDCD